MGIFSKINFGLSKTRNKMAGAIDSLFADGGEITDDLYAELEEILVMGDVGVVTAVEITERLKKRVSEKRLRGADAVKNEIKEIVAELLEGGEDMGLVTVPSVVLVIGVNGVGKTTTIGKLAAMYKAEGKRVILGAADTFRAAAIDQLGVWFGLTDQAQSLSTWSSVSEIEGQQVATWRAFDVDVTVGTTDDSFLNHVPGTFEVKPGYGRSREAIAGTAPSVKGSDFVELFYKGTSLDSYYLSDANGRATALMNYYAPGAWENIVYYVEASGYTVDGVTAVYSKQGNFFDFFPSVGNGTFVSSVEIAGEAQPIDAVVEISDIGNVKIAEADAWVADPVMPASIDVSPLDNFFAGIVEKKTWTEHAIGRWYNTKTDEQVPTPEGMTFVDTHQDIWSQFEITKYGNANATYTLYEGLNNNNAWGDSDPNIANNTAVGYYVKDGSLYTLTGTNDPETSTTTWNSDDAPVQGMSGITDMFDTSLTPCNVFTGADLELGGQSLGATMLELTSFYDKKTTDTGTTYYFNHNGPDTEIGTGNPGSVGTYYFGLAMADSIIAFYTAYYMVETGYIYDYVTMGFDLTTAGDELTYWIDFNYSSTIHYEIRVTLSDVGTDNVPQSLKDKTAATVTPAE